MAISPNFFNKRETESATARHVVPLPTQGAGYGAASTTPTQPVASPAVVAANASAAGPTGGSKLIVGPNIKLKGVEITDCDTLVVEGLVEATMDSRLMEIAEQGSFKGSAEIDVAEIRGQFDGNLTVRQKLVIYATGKVTGKIRYGKVVIEEGGQLTGDIQSGAIQSPRPGRAEKPELAVAG
ncbi:MAG: polymer-forming cytoskeletal protein [Rhodoferax sp.]|jgi:cytoskeletal protein CcmA (bactofilin family)|uniref:bactofilin family protein n=1 Tax=Rhodoferax sp. TaxID=50421 RepID=UPI003BAF5226